jgi:hypothetical protein
MLRLAQPAPSGLGGWLSRAAMLPGAPRRLEAHAHEAGDALMVTGIAWGAARAQAHTH